MREIKVDRKELLEKVRANREKHRTEYLEAVADYRRVAFEEVEKAIGRLKRTIDELESGQTIRLNTIVFNLQVPEDHTKDYDQVITMLEMSVEDVLLIKSDEFSKYVMDNWDWKFDFENTKMSYSNRGA